MKQPKTQTGIQSIPLNLLVPSNDNVRRTNRLDGVQELAASIEAHGLRQNLNVKTDGDTFAVVAGQRRLAALRSLADVGKLPADHPIPCLVLADNDNAAEISLVENELRVAMHPADQFTAFKALADKGMSVEDIAARFGVVPSLVTRRLRLAAVSPAIIERYRAGDVSLDMVMACTLASDHALQEKAVDSCGNWNQATNIRRVLTDGMKRSSESLVKFVGLDAYEAAGGTLTRDLFSDENTAYIHTPELIESLAQDKMDKLAEETRAEGWAWVESTLGQFPYEIFEHLRPIGADDGDEDEEYDSDTEFEDDEVEKEEATPEFTAEDKARSGVQIELYSGVPRFSYGLIRRTSSAASSTEKAKKDPTALAPKVIEELTKHRTAAIRLELTKNRRVARIALVHALVSVAVARDSYMSKKCLTISMTVKGTDTPNPEECQAHGAMAKIAQDWQKRIPSDQRKLFAWVAEQTDDVLDELLTVCTALSFQAVKTPNEGEWTSKDYIATSHELASLLGLDMGAHWEPTADGFYSRLSKPVMQHALTAAGKPEEATKLGILKKAPAAEATAKAIVGTGWLPEPLRQPK